MFNSFNKLEIERNFIKGFIKGNIFKVQPKGASKSVKQRYIYD